MKNMTFNSRLPERSCIVVFLALVSAVSYIFYFSLPHISYYYKMDNSAKKCLHSYFEKISKNLKPKTNGRGRNNISNESGNGGGVAAAADGAPILLNESGGEGGSVGGSVDAAADGAPILLKDSVGEGGSVGGGVDAAAERAHMLLNESDSLPSPQQPAMLVVVTFWRSGSTWLGELLSRTPNAFYLFEPVQMLTTDIHFDIGYNVSSAEASSVVRQMLLCSISKEFVDFTKKWSLVYAKKYCQDKSCLNYYKISNHCLSSDYRIIKTVRMSIEKIEELFGYPTLSNLKVIFLVRDPRGTANSFSHLKKDFQGRFWTLGVEEICPRLEANINSFNQLKMKFPERLFFIRYEDLALNPIEKSLEIWKFINSDRKPNALLPREWLTFIEESIAPKTNSSTNIKDRLHVTQRSTSEWQSWRSTISDGLLTNVQEYCGRLIEKLGYKLFDTIEEAQNLSIDVLSARNCTRIPCNNNYVRKLKIK